MTYSVTIGTNATTTYSGYEFDSFCRGADGLFYGIKADGLYVLSGDADDGDAIAASVDFGYLSLGTPQMKRCEAVYLAVSSEQPMIVGVNGYEYPTRGSGSELRERRADIGKGIRETFLAVSVRNKNGSNFELESIELKPAATGRRI
jgi:hypothetical protein